MECNVFGMSEIKIKRDKVKDGKKQFSKKKYSIKMWKAIGES